MREIQEIDRRADPGSRQEGRILPIVHGVWVGIWVLGEVEGQDFADHTVPLLKEGKMSGEN